jgi:hypothetical protein
MQFDCRKYGHIYELSSDKCVNCGFRIHPLCGNEYCECHDEEDKVSIYYSPEEHGLEVFGVLDEPDMCYEFHTLAVWKGLHDGRLRYAEDSGCSCPSPFEECHSTADLTEITHDSLDQFWTDVNDFCGYSTQGDLACEKTKLLSAVTAALPPLDVSSTIAGLERIARDLAS